MPTVKSCNLHPISDGSRAAITTALPLCGGELYDGPQLQVLLQHALPKQQLTSLAGRVTPARRPQTIWLIRRFLGRYCVGGGEAANADTASYQASTRSSPGSSKSGARSLADADIVRLGSSPAAYQMALTRKAAKTAKKKMGTVATATAAHRHRLPASAASNAGFLRRVPRLRRRARGERSANPRYGPYLDRDGDALSASPLAVIRWRLRASLMHFYHSSHELLPCSNRPGTLLHLRR